MSNKKQTHICKWCKAETWQSDDECYAKPISSIDHIVDTNKKVTAVESIIQKINNVKPNEFCSIETIKEWCNEAKAMEKEQMIEAINQVSENNVKYANMIIASWSQIEGELFTHNTKLAEQYYKENYEKS